MRFLADLEPGAFVCDVGSGDGRYLATSVTNPLIYTIGVDRCFRLTKLARAKGGEVSISDRSFIIMCVNYDLVNDQLVAVVVVSLLEFHSIACYSMKLGKCNALRQPFDILQNDSIETARKHVNGRISHPL